MYRRFNMMLNGIGISGENINYSYTGASQDLGVAEMPDGQHRLIRLTSSGTLSFTGDVGRTIGEVCIINGGQDGYTGNSGPRNTDYPLTGGEYWGGQGGNGSLLKRKGILIDGETVVTIGQAGELTYFGNITPPGMRSGGLGAELFATGYPWTEFNAEAGQDGEYPFGYIVLGIHGSSGGGGARLQEVHAGADGGENAGNGGNYSGAATSATTYGCGGGGGCGGYTGMDEEDPDYDPYAQIPLNGPGGSGYQGCVYLRIPVL